MTENFSEKGQLQTFDQLFQLPVAYAFLPFPLLHFSLRTTEKELSKSFYFLRLVKT